MFVGDSLSLNQWQSLICMLHAAVPWTKTTFVRQEDLSSLTFEVGFASSPLPPSSVDSFLFFVFISIYGFIFTFENFILPFH